MAVLDKAPEELTEAEIIYDWNELDRPGPLFPQPIAFFDETLRDGIQSASVTDPPIEDKLRILYLLDQLGIDSMDIGLPGAGQRATGDVHHIVREIRDQRLRVKPACAARTHPSDIAPIIDIAQELGQPLEVMAFIGSSPIRLYAEGWDLDRMLRLSAEAIDMAVRAGLPVTYVTEDTTRSRPDILTQLFRNAIDHGATRLCLCDTVGHVTPDGIRHLIRFTRDFISTLGQPIGIDWHGHNDRGLGVCNALYALEYGADRVHGTILGVGERVGNAAIDQILVNLKLLGHLPDRDLTRLIEVCQLVSRAYNVPIPYNYPVAGSDAFRTATGVHAAAIIKAERKGHAFLADRVYSGVPASMVGREQELEVGYMSGESNVIYWLRQRGLSVEPGLVKTILGVAKSSAHVLSAAEIHQIIEDYQTRAKSPAPPLAP